MPGFWIYQSSEYTRVLNIPGFWIYQSSEYTTALNMLVVPNIPRFLICQGYRGLWICLRICLNMPEYAWIYLHLPEWLLFSKSSIGTILLRQKHWYKFKDNSYPYVMNDIQIFVGSRCFFLRFLSYVKSRTNMPNVKQSKLPNFKIPS